MTWPGRGRAGHKGLAGREQDCCQTHKTFAAREAAIDSTAVADTTLRASVRLVGRSVNLLLLKSLGLRLCADKVRRNTAFCRTTYSQVWQRSRSKEC